MIFFQHNNEGFKQVSDSITLLQPNVAKMFYGRNYHLSNITKVQNK
jgi:hypothetical protein